MSKHQANRQWHWIWLGVGMIVFGLWFISQKVIVITWVSKILAIILLLAASRRFFKMSRHYLYTSERDSLSSLSLLTLAIEIIMAIFLFKYSSQATYILIQAIAIYYLLLSVINTVNLIILIKNHTRQLLGPLLRTLSYYILFGLAYHANEDQLTILTIMGIYMVLIGLTFIRDGRRVMSAQETEEKPHRRLRFPIPIFLSVLMPRHFLGKINRFLEEDYVADAANPLVHEIRPPAPPPLDHQVEILIRVSRMGFGNIGHVNIAYQNKVFNYGNFDKQSRMLGGLVGDGVIAVVDKDKFYDLAMAVQDTIVEYVIQLTHQQAKTLEAKLSRLADHWAEWQMDTDSQLRSFGGLLKRRADAKLYKFHRGKFKNFFVLGSNCVMLSDYLLGATDLDVFPIVGVLTPGTYFDYLNREYKKEGSAVVHRQVYSRRIKKYLGLTQTNKIDHKEMAE